MTIPVRLGKPVSILAFCLAAALILVWDILRPGPWGFADAAGIPYLSLIPAAYLISGSRLGILFNCLVPGFLLLVVPAFHPEGFAAGFSAGIRYLGISLPFSLLLGIVAALTRLDRRISLGSVLSRLREAVRTSHRQANAIEEQKTVLAELEHRIRFQNDSLLLLFSQLKKLERSDFYSGLDLMLESFRSYTDCTRATLWKYEREESRLVLLSFLGYPESERPFPYRSVDETLQDWAVRNNRTYSVRMLQDYPNLLEIDDQRTIFAVPFTLDNRPWGVLSIEEMPFERYNHHTESLLAILTRVMEPVLNRLYEFEQSFARSERDDSTGLPLYGMLLRSLTGQLTLAARHQTSLSLVILEMPRVPEQTSREDLKLHLLDTILEFETEIPNQAQLFHFKEDNQLALLIPNLDEDGTAMFCLNMLAAVANVPNSPEIVVGYSCIRGTEGRDAQSMVQAAEHLLEIQKI